MFKKNKTFIIAEISTNHSKSLKKIYDLIDAVKNCGADAVKFQTYTPEQMTLNIDKKEFKINENRSLWKGMNLFDLYSIGSLPLEWHKKIYSYARKKNIIPFSSVFDIQGVEFLEKIKCPIYKVASLENNHYPLLKRLAKTKKPIILSTGATKFSEITNSVKYLKKNGCKKLFVLKCSSIYPSRLCDLNLKALEKISRLNCVAGFSDHSLGSVGAVVAVSLGAKIVEKHVKLKNSSSLDSKFSMPVHEFKQYVQNIRDAEFALGNKEKFILNREKFARTRKRSIIVVKNIKKGDFTNSTNIKVLRPNIGDHPKYYEKTLNRAVKKNLSKGQGLKLSYLR